MPIALTLIRPGRASTRQAVAVGQMLVGALLIHLTGGRSETHFHVFVSLAFLSLYRDWRVLATATVVASLDHYLRGIYWPRSIFGVLVASPWRWTEHVGWVLFEVIILVFSCSQSLRSIRDAAYRKAGLEANLDQYELAVAGRTVELETSNKALMCEIVERRNAEANALQAQKLSEVATKSKSEFLANMSHEIRTPMNGILGMTDLVLETKLTPTQREYLGLVKMSANSLLTIINDILDSSKIEAGKLELDQTEFDLRETLSATLKPIASRAHAKRLELSCDVDLDVPDILFGDEGRLRQVLNNLVGNAVKFTPDGEVVLRVGHDPDPGAPAHSLRFSVIDTGIGVPLEKHQIIFQAFTQADSSTTRKFGGTGLGLAISHDLVELMGGRLWVESQPGCGSIFHFTATLPPSSTHALTNIQDAASELKDLRILIVDDNATSLAILGKIVIGWGMEPTLCNSGPVGLEVASNAVAEGCPFPLILLDATVSKMDIFDGIGQIDANGIPVKTTILMLSSAAQLSYRGSSQANDSNCWLIKPVSQSELLLAIRRTLSHATTRVGDESKTNPTYETTSSIPPLCILLAEDNVVNQKLAVHLLEKQGHQVVVASDGKKALDLLMVDHFDLVIMDVHMPIMDGIEATAALRHHESQNGGHLPIIALTANAMQSDRDFCLRAGFDDYVTKPIYWPYLEAAMKSQTRTLSPSNFGKVRGALSGPIFDLASAMNLVGGDIEILKEVAVIFLDECPQLFDQLVDAVERQDARSIEFAAHKFRGAVATFSSLAIDEIVTRLERIGALGKVVDASEVFLPLPGFLKQLKCDLDLLITN